MKKGSHHSSESREKIKEKRKLQICTDETKDKMRLKRLNWKWSDDVKTKMSETRKRIVQERPELRDFARKSGKLNLGRKHTEETRIKDSQATKSRWENPKHREKQKESRKKRWEKLSKEARSEIGFKVWDTLKKNPKSLELRNQNLSEGMTQYWDNCDPEVKAKRIQKSWETAGRGPNNAEKLVTSVTQDVFPNEYIFSGAGKIFIGGKCPDLFNVNGKKKVIELFGNYYHGKERTGRTKAQEEQQRINHFKKYGFDCLIIWESELKNIESLKQKLIDFNGS